MADVRVLLVDDHPVVRAGLRAMLTEFEGISITAEAADGKAALKELSRLAVLGDAVDVVLMDLQMGAGMDGVAATAAIRKLAAPPPVLILTTYDTDADILAAVEAGASGYMLKDAPPEQIRQAVFAAAAGETVLAPKAAKQVFISEATVKTHLVHIYGKLGVDNRTAAIAAATQRRIIRPPGQAS